MPEVEDIVDFCFGKSLSGKKVIVTAGGTREAIDEVRFIGNRSSGRMGLEIAKAARDAGASVKLIACNLDTTPAGMEVVHVKSVDELEQAMDHPADAIVMAAAVSDFRVRNPYLGKLSRSQTPNLDIVPTKDLIASYCAKYPKSFAVAFTLSDDKKNLASVSKKKLWDKGVALMVGNTTEALGSDTTAVLLVSRESVTEHEGPKSKVAKLIVEAITNHFVH